MLINIDRCFLNWRYYNNISFKNLLYLLKKKNFKQLKRYLKIVITENFSQSFISVLFGHVGVCVVQNNYFRKLL